MTVCLDYQPGLFFSVTPDSFLSVIPDKRSAIRNPGLGLFAWVKINGWLLWLRPQRGLDAGSEPGMTIKTSPA